MIRLTQEELWAFNILNGTVANQQAEVNRSIAARQAFIGALEIKYNATFDPASGQFKPKEKPKTIPDYSGGDSGGGGGY